MKSLIVVLALLYSGSALAGPAPCRTINQCKRPCTVSACTSFQCITVARNVPFTFYQEGENIVISKKDAEPTTHAIDRTKAGVRLCGGGMPLDEKGQPMGIDITLQGQ